MYTSSYKTFLMHSTTGEEPFTKLLDIKDFPDLGGEPELLDTTTLSDSAKTSIPGIQQVESLQFTANYTKEDYEKIVALKGKEQTFMVYFGGTGDGETLEPTGDLGKWKIVGNIDIYVTGKGVDEVREMVLTIAPSKPIHYEQGA